MLTKFAEFLRFERCKRMHILSGRKMLKNDYLFAKIGVDTAENEPDVEV